MLRRATSRLAGSVELDEVLQRELAHHLPGEVVEAEERVGEQREQRAEVDDAEPQQRRHEQQREQQAAPRVEQVRDVPAHAGAGAVSARLVMPPLPRADAPRARPSAGAPLRRRRAGRRASGRSACSVVPAASTLTRVKAPKYCTSLTTPLARAPFSPPSRMRSGRSIARSACRSDARAASPSSTLAAPTKRATKRRGRRVVDLAAACRPARAARG